MQLTPNYNLKKPEGADPVDIQDFNDNADVVDAALKKKAESSGGDISEMTVKTLDNITTDFPVPVAGEKPKTFLGKVKKFFEDTKNWMTGVCLIGSIVNNCVTDNAKLPLSAAQGKALMDLYTVLNTNLPYKYLTSYNVPNGGTLLSEVVSAHNAGYRCFIVYAMGNVLDAPSNAYAQVRVTNGDNRYIVCEWMNDNEARGYVAKRMIDTQTMQWAGNWSVPVLNSDLANRLVMNTGSTGIQSPFSGSTSHRLQIGMDGGVTVWKTTDGGTTWNIVKNL